MRVRLFGSKTCSHCQSLETELVSRRVPFEFVDAYDFDNPETDALCEVNGVNEIPHLQLLDESGNVVKQWISEVDVDDLTALLSSHSL